MRLEPPVQEYAESGGGQVHQGGIAPPLLRPMLTEPGPEGRHLFLNLEHNLASEGLAELVLPGQSHITIPLRLPEWLCRLVRAGGRRTYPSRGWSRPEAAPEPEGHPRDSSPT